MSGEKSPVFKQLLRLPRRAPNFSKLCKLVHRSPHFDLISSEIVFSDLRLCAGRFKKKIEGVKLPGLRVFG